VADCTAANILMLCRSRALNVTLGAIMLERAVALAAVDKVGSHCRLCLLDGPGVDGGDDRAMFLLERHEVGAQVQGADSDAGAGDDEAAEEVQETAELRISRCIRNDGVKGEVLADGCFATVDRRVDR
jgi:hypothetical protein